MKRDYQPFRRRTVLRTIGAGVAGMAATASASADPDKGNNYGNGNGLGAFLDEEAQWNDDPWDNDVIDKTGQPSVNVDVGTLTTINVPFAPGPVEEPFGFGPQAVKVSPGTEVTWTWVSEIHHSVTSYNEAADDPTDPSTTGDHGQLFDQHGHEGHSFSHTFDDGGTYLYFCHPHGTPYPAYDPFLEEVPGVDPVQENLLGMRGAVLVPGR